jgi:hypothetical protein
MTGRDVHLLGSPNTRNQDILELWHPVLQKPCVVDHSQCERGVWASGPLSPAWLLEGQVLLG